MIKKYIILAGLFVAALGVASSASADNILADGTVNGFRVSIKKKFNIELGECLKVETRKVRNFAYGEPGHRRECVEWRIVKSSNPRFPVGGVMRFE